VNIWQSASQSVFRLMNAGVASGRAGGRAVAGVLDRASIDRIQCRPYRPGLLPTDFFGRHLATAR